MSRVTRQLRQVAGVEKIKADYKKSTFTVTPKKERTPSPRSLWDAVKKSGFTPTKIVTPKKTYTKRPPA